ncbi:uncharacterized protein LOC131597151 [Vicia villosa]|uniref:uncharacterized protein LOC131597151 n=1 Tax=Vicia villosa TaxID=3911 RepID=UPI00273C9B83|nr:uncharacterized protein LOC131597151 [Vicia villosa]
MGRNDPIPEVQRKKKSKKRKAAEEGTSTKASKDQKRKKKKYSGNPSTFISAINSDNIETSEPFEYQSTETHDHQISKPCPSQTLEPISPQQTSDHQDQNITQLLSDIDNFEPTSEPTEPSRSQETNTITQQQETPIPASHLPNSTTSEIIAETDLQNPTQRESSPVPSDETQTIIKPENQPENPVLVSTPTNQNTSELSPPIEKQI